MTKLHQHREIKLISWSHKILTTALYYGG